MKKILLILFIISASRCQETGEDQETRKNLPVYGHDKVELDTDYWYTKGKNDIEKFLGPEPLVKRAKNVILFIGDGMSLTTLTAARILKGQLTNRSGEEGSLFFERFPYNSLIKTYNADKQVPDSAGTATAFLTGVKANYETIAVNAQIKSGDTDCQKALSNSVPSILKWAVDQGKAAGVVTTTRITHATPAASYAHSAHRDWEADINLPPELNQDLCKDIARQLIEDDPGKRLKVILGGGRRNFLPKSSDPQSNLQGSRNDDKNLVEDWVQMKKQQGWKESQYKFVTSTKELREAASADDLQYLFGLFNQSHMSYETERDSSPDGEPSLTEMATTAINILSRDPRGFVLLIEGGRIDHAHHKNMAGMALRETISFDNAIEESMKLINKNETLVIVTADHAHTLTINGYPDRGNSIFGFSNDNDTDNKPFTTLMYGNGPGYQKDRQVPSDPSNPRTVFHSAVQLPHDSNHGGEDVGLYSRGPFAHLFHGLQDQTFIAHAIGYAACIGNYNQSKHCSSSGIRAKPEVLLISSLSFFFFVILMFRQFKL